MISVIIPAYNAEKTLRRCFFSIINQTYRDFEVLFVDDGSTDKTLDLCNEFAVIDNRIKVLKNLKKGVSAARNLGIKKASGEFIFFVDSDDWIEEHAFELLVNKIIDDESDICFGGFCLEYPDKTKQVDEINLQTLCNNPRDITKVIISEKYEENERLLLRDNVSGYIWRCLFKKSIIKTNNLRFEEALKFSEDRVFLISYLNHAAKASFINDVIYHYNKQNLDSASYLLANSYRKDFLKERQELETFLESAIQKSLYLDKSQKNDMVIYLKYKFAYEILQNALKLPKEEGITKLVVEIDKKIVSDLITKDSFKMMKKLHYKAKKKIIYFLIKHRKWRVLFYILKHE